MNQQRKPLKGTHLIKVLQLLLLIVCLTMSAAANTSFSRDREGLVFSNNTLINDILPPDRMVANPTFEDDSERLHPLQWDHVKQNHKINHLLHLHREAQMDQRGIPGYRVHLFMDSGNRARLNTQHKQADFEEKYPDQKSYIVYEEPYFKLRAGDFRTRLDARRFLEKIRRDYPAAYIVVDRINYPEID